MPPPVEVSNRDSHGQLHLYDDNETSGLQKQESSSREYPGNQPSLPGRNANALLNRLEELPELRSIPWRPGLELPREQCIDSARMQKRAATLLVMRGKIADTPCSLCVAGRGRFSLCVRLDPWFMGACASCSFMSKAKDCSFREESLEVEDSPLRAKKRKRKSMRDLQQTDHALYSVPNTQLQQSIPISPDLESMLQAEMAREEYREDNLQTERGWDTRKASYELESKMAKRHNEEPARYGNSSQPHKTPYSASTSIIVASKPVQTVWAAGRVLLDQLSEPASSTLRRGRPSNDVAIIDTLARSNQSRIFGTVSGLQGGIDHLQQQLDSLKTLFGIDTDSDND